MSASYFVTAVRFRHQQLLELLLGQGEGPGRWEHEPHVVPVDEVVRLLDAGHPVHALLRDAHQVQAGPRLKVVTNEDGERSVALDTMPADCLELADLERF